MDRLIIAEVLKPQGIRGELKIKTFTDFPQDVKAFKTVYIDESLFKQAKAFEYLAGVDCSVFVCDYDSPKPPRRGQ